MNTPTQPEPSTTKKPAPTATPGSGINASPVAAGARKTDNNKENKPVSPGKKTAPPQSPATRSAADPQRKRGIVAALALVVAIGAAAGSYVVWHITNTNQQQLAELKARNDAMSGAVNTLSALQSTVTQEQNKLKSLTGRFDAVETNQQQINDSIEALHTEVSRDRKSGWMVAEAEYLVRVAGQRLKLADDVDTAIAALMAADERLKSTGDPSLIDARSAIADDINSLQSVTLPDITGMALSLGSLENRVDDLPLDEPEAATPPPPEAAGTTATDGWAAAVDRAWTAIKSLVVVTRDSDSGKSPLLTPDQRALLRQNLRLKLETARIALLNRDTQVFQNSLQTTRNWVTTYFPESTSRQNMLDSLARLEGTELSPALPEISASLQALRNWSTRQRGGTAMLSPSSPGVVMGIDHKDTRS